MTRLLFLILALSGCATAKKESIYLGGGSFVELPTPSELQTPKRAIQIITVQHLETKKTFEGIFENQNGQISIAVLSPLWPTPMKVTYDGKDIVSNEYLKKNVPFDFKYVLADMVLIYADQDLLKSKLNLDSRIQVQGLNRKILDVSNEKPKVIADIQYENSDPFLGTVRLENLIRKYKISIQTTKVEK